MPTVNDYCMKFYIYLAIEILALCQTILNSVDI